jgi:hypothetical protein
MLSWQNLREQFGQEYAESKDFKREFRDVLRQVTVVYPAAHIAEVDGGIMLYPSAPPSPKRRSRSRSRRKRSRPRTTQPLEKVIHDESPPDVR